MNWPYAILCFLFLAFLFTIFMAWAVEIRQRRYNKKINHHHQPRHLRLVKPETASNTIYDWENDL